MSSSERRDQRNGRDRGSVVRAARVDGRPRVLGTPREPAVVRREAEEARLSEATEAAYRRGLEAGREEIRRELAAQSGEVATWLESQGEELRSVRARYLESAETEVLELVKALTQKILVRSVEGSPESIRKILREVLAGIADRDEIAVRVHPESIEAYRALSASLAGSVTAPEGIRWVPDRRAARWGVVVDTEAGTIDASVEAQLEEAAALFMEVLRGRDD